MDDAPSPPSISSSEPIDDKVTTDVVNREMNVRVTDDDDDGIRRHIQGTKLPAELNFNDASPLREPDAPDDTIAILRRPPPNVVTHRVRTFPLIASP